MEGQKELLGMWLSETEGAKFWLNVLTGLQNRGVKHQPRLDVSGTDLVTVMDSMDEDIIATLQKSFAETRVRPNGVSPNFFALPQLVEREASGEASGACFIPSPHARVSAAD